MPEVQLIHLSDFEFNDSALIDAKTNRSKVEYYFTCTPSLPLYIFRNFSEVDSITYLDADLFFFSDPAPYFDEIANCSIAIVGHRYPKSLKWLEKNGFYNVGILFFRNDINGNSCLEWWRKKCIEWCHDYSENGLYADQKYLDVWPKKFKAVHIVSNIGINVAPWNIGDYFLSVNKSNILVDNIPIIVFHFHGLKQITNGIFDPNLHNYEVKASAVLTKNIYKKYINNLRVIHSEILKDVKKNVKLSTIRSSNLRKKKSNFKVINFAKKVKRFGLIALRVLNGRYIFFSIILEGKKSKH